VIKVVLSFPIAKFHKKYFEELVYINYVIINASNEGFCVEFGRKNNTTFCFYFQIDCKY